MTGRADDQSEERIKASLFNAFEAGEEFTAPYRHWILRRLLPEDDIAALSAIEFPLPDLHGVSGKRELHNDQRHYVDAENRSRFAVFERIANVFQSSDTAARIEKIFGANLDGTYLRIEYAQDSEGFWLEPHTDLGVKRLTMLIYLAPDDDSEALGTDIYDGERQWIKRAPFGENIAMTFVPGAATYHGFEKRAMTHVRKSLILNYVTDEWRERGQLAFPDAPIGA